MVRRKDAKGRVLNDGETQGKDGRYRYQYTDVLGNRKAVYSWKLLPSDKTPSGKRKGLSLREKEKQIKEDLNSGIIPCGGDMTVLDLVEKYASQKTGVRHNTKASYDFVINVIKKEEFGAKRIDKIKLSDAKAWFIKLQADGRGYSSIHSIRGVVRPAFQMAVDDDFLLKNPFDFKLSTVVINDSTTRQPLTEKQEQQFLDFIRKDSCFSKYYDGIFVLFKTGMRVSEFVGLTISDLDMKNRKIIIDHQLQRARDMRYVIDDTKTTCGVREIPMTEEVYERFVSILHNRKRPKVEPIIDGRSGFVFIDKNDMPTVSLHWEKYFQRILRKYNKVHKVQMPKITPHVCRHTFCSNMAKSGMNPKTLQYIMGHSDIGLTLNTYTHVRYDDVKKEMENICKANIGHESVM